MLSSRSPRAASHLSISAVISTAAGCDGIRTVIAQKDVPTAYGVIVTDKTGDNRVTVYGGAALTALDVEPFRACIEECDILLINNEVPEEVNVAAVRIAKSCGKQVILNPAPVRDICDHLLTNVDIFISIEVTRRFVMPDIPKREETLALLD